jgi:hypothetical protein
MLFPSFIASTKKPQPETRLPGRFLRAAALPVGPSLDHRRHHVPAPILLPFSSGMPTRRHKKIPLESIEKSELPEFRAT